METSLVYMLFGKSIRQLEISDLLSFFTTEKVETDKLEFKSYTEFQTANSTKASRDKEKLNDILKSICAFLNSDGGLLIWGAPEGKNVDGLKEKIYKGDLSPVKFQIEKDQFINRVASEINPTPHRILFHSISINPDSFCYIFEIVKSEFAPHQYKGTYYMRLDGSTRPAPHYYVEALIKKISFPKIEVYMNFGEMLTGKNHALLPITFTIHNLSKYINEKNVEYRIICDTCNIRNPNQLLDNEYLEVGCEIQKKAKEVLHCNMPYYDEFVLISKRLMPDSKSIHARIMISVWGELSPVIVSTYHLEIHGNKNVHTEYEIVEKEENFYIYEKSEELHGDDRIAKSNSLLLKSFEKRFITFPLFRQLY